MTKKDKYITGFENIEILDMGGAIQYFLRYTEKSDKSAFDNFSIRYAHPWVQLLFDSGLSSRGAFFFLVDLGPGAAVGGMRIEINTGCSCYLICNNS